MTNFFTVNVARYLMDTASDFVSNTEPEIFSIGRYETFDTKMMSKTEEF